MKGLLFFGLMYSNSKRYEAVLSRLEERFGKLLKDSGAFDFNFTANYEKEFGHGLKKIFLVFDTPINRDQLPEIKLWAHQLEAELSIDSKRTINIDPGYITPNNVIVASTKDHPHRVYLGQGVFGDVQLILRKEEVETFPHTYPDYSSQQEFFSEMRRLAPRD